MASIGVCPEKEHQISSPASSRFGNSTKYAVIFLLSLFIAFILQPRIGVRDVDSYSYIMGAYSIRAGNGYRDLSGELLNHFPPGYSFILSLFPSPLRAALLLNYLFFGAAIVLVYRLARDIAKWGESPALGLATAIGFIFLRRMATNATADMLTYAAFLLGAFLHYKGTLRLRILSYLIWGLVIPIKLIAVVFIPAAVLARYLGRPVRFIRAEWGEIVIAFAIWSLSFSIPLVYNFLTIQSPLPGTHTGSNQSYSSSFLFGGASHFLTDIPRSFLSNWYGSIGTAFGLVPFCLVLLVALACLATLRLHTGYVAKHAILLIALLGLLQFATHQVAGTRLTGYGLILFFFGFYPAGRWYKVWALYGLLGFAVSAFNALTQNSLGVNDPRYEQLAQESLKIGMPPGKIFTNSFHVLDIHAKVATQHIRSVEHLGDAEYFFRVSLPAYDAVATSVLPVEMPGEGWCEVASLTGAKLYRRCP